MSKTKKKQRPYKMNKREKPRLLKASKMARWRLRLRQGDMVKIADSKPKCHELTIQRVFKSGFATKSIEAKIDKYFSK